MSTELLCSRFGGQCWAALREDGSVVELRVERDGQPPQVGRIVKARVTRVLPGLQSAFVDIGTDRDAFLHVADLLLPGERPAGFAPHRLAPPDGDGADPAEEETPGPELVEPAITRHGPIQDRLRVGRELLVQIAREGFGSKGPRVTCFVSLPGRYVVYMPQVPHLGISRRITDLAERERLRAILAAVAGGHGGFIVRTAGAGAAAGALEADAARLVHAWREISRRAEAQPAPQVVHVDVGLMLRLLRDAPREGLSRVVVDGPEDRDRAFAYLRDVDPALASLVTHHPGPGPLWEAEGLDVEIERALRPRVWLRSGGTLVIEPTEALVSIDVNTGKYVGRGQLEDTVLRTNLEAADEIARQLRLRDLGGIIVVDFIDMESPDSRRRVLEAFEQALARDRARTKIVGLSELGLVQLTRKRTRRGIEALLTRPCPSCGGQGRVKSAGTLASEALAEARRVVSSVPARTVRVRAHPELARALLLSLQEGACSGGALASIDLRVEEDPSLAADQYHLLVT